jgi:hypothetical protein
MPNSLKKTEPVKFLADEALFLELSRLAAADDRTLSEYIYVMACRHVYGHAKRGVENIEGTNRSES